MGVEYSSGAAYGFCLIRNRIDLEPMWDDQYDPDSGDMHDWWYGDGNKWLSRIGCGLVTTDTGGNGMSGPIRFGFSIRSTMTSVGRFEDSAYVTELNSDQVSSEALRQIAEVRERIPAMHECSIGWKLFFDIS